MSGATAGHAAQDAQATVAGQLADLPDDEARGAFLVAAVNHAERQYEILAAQAEKIAEKAEDVIEAWQAKTDEAYRMRDRVAADLEVYRSALENRVGF